MFNKSIIALAIVGCFAVLPAAATTITVTNFVDANPPTVTITNVVPPLSEVALSGRFNSLMGTTNFISWCADIFQDLTLGQPVTDYTLVSAISQFGATRADALGRLATQHLGSVSDAETASAFQLAIWEILFESSTNSYNLSSGNFSASNASDGSIGLAQGWLGNLGPKNDYSVSIYDSPTKQDLAVFTTVPEPASLGLLALGLIGIGFLKRRSGGAG